MTRLIGSDRGRACDELRRFTRAGRPRGVLLPSVTIRFWRWCRRNPWLAGDNIAATAATMILVIGSTIAAKVDDDGREQVAAVAHELVGALKSDSRELSRPDGGLLLAGSAIGSVNGLISWERIGKAAKIGRGLGYTAERLDPFGDEAIA